MEPINCKASSNILTFSFFPVLPCMEMEPYILSHPKGHMINNNTTSDTPTSTAFPWNGMLISENMSLGTSCHTSDMPS